MPHAHTPGNRERALVWSAPPERGWSELRSTPLLLSLSFVNIARREVCSLHTPWHWRWLVFAVFVGAHSFNWHAVATMATWFMTLLIQRAEHRDAQAIQAELDELLHAQAKARNHLTHIDEFEAEDIERHRKEARTND